MFVFPRRFSHILSAAVFATLGMVGQGRAADLDMPPLIQDAPRPALVELGTGWYLRGDIGYRINQNPSASYGGSVPFSGEKIDNDLAVGGGIGYKFTNWFRTDVTADYGFDGKFKGSSACYANCGSSTVDAHAKVLPTSFMLNAYLDLGNWYGITPYVGAGIGASYVRVESYSFNNPNGLYDTSGYPIAVPGYGLANAWKLGFSYAFMAGLSFQLSQNLLIDAGYRYLSIGEGHTSADTAGNRVKIKDLKTQEIRLGLRYMIDGI